MTPVKMDIFRHLMVINTLRGKDGGGLISVPKDKSGKTKVFRTNETTAADMMYDSAVSQYFSKKEHLPSCIVGHARFPTSGGNALEDCHPFIGSHTIGVHNGTLETVNGTPITKKDHDSKLLFRALDASRQPVRVLADTKGPMALVWVNKQTQRLWFFRNKDRPLHLAMVEGDPETLFWSSEADGLAYVLKRKVNSKVRILSLEPNKLVSFPLRPVKNVEMDTTILVPEVARSSVFTTKDAAVTEDALLTILQTGCSNCIQPASFDDYKSGKIVFFKANEFMCETCLSYDITARRECVDNNVDVTRIPFIGGSKPEHTTH